MARHAVTRLANAMRSSQRREVKRSSTRSIEAEVTGLEPFELDGGELGTLTDEDVTIGRALEVHLEDEPLEEGDTLVLVETEPGDYTAVDVLPGGGS